MKIFLAIVALTGLLVFYSPARAQGQGQGQGAAESPVGVVPETPDPEPTQAILKLVGSDCDFNEAEASLLRTNGIVAVDVEVMKDHLVVDYFSAKVTALQMVDTVRGRMMGTDAIGRRMGGEKARSRGCFAQIVPAGGGLGNPNP